MLISFEGVVVDIFTSEKGVIYASFAVLGGSGGQVKIGFPPDVKLSGGAMVKVEGIVKPKMGQYGLNLAWIEGNLSPIK